MKAISHRKVRIWRRGWGRPSAERNTEHGRDSGVGQDGAGWGETSWIHSARSAEPVLCRLWAHANQNPIHQGRDLSRWSPRRSQSHAREVRRSGIHPVAAGLPYGADHEPTFTRGRSRPLFFHRCGTFFPRTRTYRLRVRPLLQSLCHRIGTLWLAGLCHCLTRDCNRRSGRTRTASPGAPSPPRYQRSIDESF